MQQQSLEGDICVCAFCGRGGATFFRLLFIAPKEEVILENWKRLMYFYNYDMLTRYCELKK
jgi:hypothetical protein